MADSILSAVNAVRGTSSSSGARRAGSGSAPGLGEVPFDDILSDLDFQNNEGDLTRLFDLQIKMNRETLFYTGMSNIAKARHETAMNAVRNVRS
ncbi:MAG: hypothetical protein AAGC60_01735 [Acidobacteriota bacterium]